MYANVHVQRGAFEVGSGTPSPPPSPSTPPQYRRSPSSIVRARKRSGDAAHHITEECERLFCDTLRTVFSVEGNSGFETSLVVDARKNTSSSNTAGRGGSKKNSNSNVKANSAAVRIPVQPQQHGTVMKHNLPTPSPSPDGRIYPSGGGMVKEYVEVWDYAGGTLFRGFVAETNNERTLFIFFDREVIGQDLKPGLMALLELAGCDDFAADQLVVCIDRNADQEAAGDVARDLKWVGFELMTLDAWSEGEKVISDRWLFLGMDV